MEHGVTVFHEIDTPLLSFYNFFQLLEYVRLFVTKTDNIKYKREDRDRLTERIKTRLKKHIIPHKKIN